MRTATSQDNVLISNKTLYTNGRNYIIFYGQKLEKHHALDMYNVMLKCAV